MRFVITIEERGLLYGLPHLSQLLYYAAIRPYMDYSTGIVGIKRGISYQSLAEELSVEAHRGIKPFKVSRDQIKRALQTLERAGLIKRESQKLKLIIRCIWAHQDNSVSNKAAPKPPPKAAPLSINNFLLNSDNYDDQFKKADTPQTAKAAIPPVSGDLIFMFNEFWQSYPQACQESRTQDVFLKIKPDERLFREMMFGLQKQKEMAAERLKLGLAAQYWKNSADWLEQRSWEEKFKK